VGKWGSEVLEVAALVAARSDSQSRAAFHSRPGASKQILGVTLAKKYSAVDCAAQALSGAWQIAISFIRRGNRPACDRIAVDVTALATRVPTCILHCFSRRNCIFPQAQQQTGPKSPAPSIFR
jgi:hypothetical protein